MDKDSFWLHVDVQGPDDCWLWQRGATSLGYGTFADQGVAYYAHRFAYEDINGPTDLCVLHSCDTPRCCNPRHLEAGTQRQNMLDKHARGRANIQYGERSGGAKKTWVEVNEIRRLAREEGIGQRELGRRFDLSHKGVAYILGKGWRNEDQYQSQSSSCSHVRGGNRNQNDS